MSNTRKRVTMTVTVSVPSWMTARQARREVRTLINDQCNYMSLGPDQQQVETDTVRASKVAPMVTRPNQKLIRSVERNFAAAFSSRGDRA